MSGTVLHVTAELWLWRPEPPAKASWHFLTIDGEAAAEIRFASFQDPRGFGSVPVIATIGNTRWRTSVFRAQGGESYLLPVKAEVRKREGVVAGDAVSATLEI